MNMNRRTCRLNLEAIFRSVKDAIITVDKECSVIELNQAAKNICHYSQDDIGKDFRTLSEGRGGKCVEAIVKTIEQGKPVELYRLECKCQHRLGQVVTLTTAPLLDDQDKFAGAVLVIRDEARLATLERALEDRRQFHNFVGKNHKMQNIYSLIEELADVQTTVLIQGESGTGKELVAEALHYRGSRRDKPLVKVNCAALPDNLLETELFGHVRGAFTGAISDKIGRFQRADGGTIFLDEIGDISPRMQLRLLRVLQEREFERVGDTTPINVDVRVVAATNQNLLEKVRRGEFREDLYYRLKVMEAVLPALRERRDDIPILANHFLRKFNAQFKKNIEGISADVQTIFMEHTWPGNVRELGHTLEHAAILCHQNTITMGHLPGNFGELLDIKSLPQPGGRQAVLSALEQTAWNKARAARLLGISRRTIYRKIEQFSIAENHA